jgi:hypothetical protein
MAVTASARCAVREDRYQVVRSGAQRVQWQRPRVSPRGVPKRAPPLPTSHPSVVELKASCFGTGFDSAASATAAALLDGGAAHRTFEAAPERLDEGVSEQPAERRPDPHLGLLEPPFEGNARRRSTGTLPPVFTIRTPSMTYAPRINARSTSAMWPE